MKLSFVIPAYRSERTITAVIEEIEQYHPGAEIMVVVDGSPDKVADVVTQQAQQRRGVDVRLIELRANRGQHYAVLRGLAEVTGDWVVTLDDDGQNPVSEVAKLLEVVRAEPSQWDCVYGSFGDDTKQSLERRLLSGLNQKLAAIFLHKPAAVSLSNVRLLRGDLARMLGRFTSPYPFVDALIFRATSHVTSLHIAQRERQVGQSNYTWARLLRLALSHYTIFSTLPLMVGSLASLALSAVVFVVTSGFVIRAVVGGQAPQGWTSLMAVTGFLFSLLFLFLSLLSLYVGRLYVSHNSSFPDYVRRSNARESS